MITRARRYARDENLQFIFKTPQMVPKKNNYSPRNKIHNEGYVDSRLPEHFIVIRNMQDDIPAQSLESEFV